MDVFLWKSRAFVYTWVRPRSNAVVVVLLNKATLAVVAVFVPDAAVQLRVLTAA